MLTSSELHELAHLLYPNVTNTPEFYEQLYPARQLPAGAMVTRLAPSPTGFIHIGGIYAALISKRLAEQSNGVFFLRIEDTDQRREIEGGTEGIIQALNDYLVPPTEGYLGDEKQVGQYGPYLQSQRMEIYSTYGKWLVEHGFAYPCFCSEAELKATHDQQVKLNLQKKGYYGEWAKDRNLPLAEVKQKLTDGKPFVLRVRAPENPQQIWFQDLVRGKVEMEENATDMVLIKSNGLPTYHFAHVVDDHLMRTTHVTRGEEWLSTAPLHIQLFKMFGFEVPVYIHFSHIGKIEGSSVRKLSKRKDPEAAVSLYTEQGYPAESVLEYLLNLANSNFSDWRRANPDLPNQDFQVDARKIGKSIAIFDQKKLDDMSRTVVSKMSEQHVYELVLAWAQKYNHLLASHLEPEKEFFTKVFAIERYQDRPRKDIAKWSEVEKNIWYFSDELFAERAQFERPAGVTAEDAKAFLTAFIDGYEDGLNKESWTEKYRSLAATLGFARDLKTFKAEPAQYKGHIGNLMGILRLAITGETNTPDLYQIIEVMGKQRVVNRVKHFIKTL